MVQPRSPEGPHGCNSAAPRGRRADVRGRNRHGAARSPGLDDDGALSAHATRKGFWGLAGSTRRPADPTLLRGRGSRLLSILTMDVEERASRGCLHCLVGLSFGFL